MRALILSLFFLILTAGFVTQARAAEETNFVVTVKARNGMFIGTAGGGAQIIIRDRRTGDIMASGTTYGAMGDPALLMADSVKRDAVLASEGTARYEFSIEFWEPTPVTVSATGPLGQPQNAVTVSEDMILIPGKDYTAGNGIMLELPGFAVDLVSPVPNQKFKMNPKVPVTIEANVMTLDGSLVEKDKPWPPERYQVEVHVYKDNLYITTMELPYSEEPGIYSANLEIPMPGIYRLLVTAFDPVTKEAGMDITTVIYEE